MSPPCFCKEGFTVIENYKYSIVFDDAFYANIGCCEYDLLLDYLSGETDTYTNKFFTLYDDPEYNPLWINDVDFGYKTTFVY